MSDILLMKCILLKYNVYILIGNSLKFIPGGANNNNAALDLVIGLARDMAAIKIPDSI